jgi:outer membrane lipopolysaccharide assembly protein LptE/RlpB
MKSISNLKIIAACGLLLLTFSFATCKYSLKDTSPIPPDVKTFRVNYLENKARYVNPQLSPTVTEKLKQKIVGQTRLRHGYISDYSVTTTGITNQNASTNRLNVSFHLIFKNTLDQKKDFEADITNNYDFDAQKSLQQAETENGTLIVKNLVDGIFNKIFSNW